MAIHVAIETVSKRFPAKGGGLLVLDGVSLEAQEGEFLSLIGPSGCGKTTLLRLIGGLEATTEGRVLVRGVEPREVQKRKEMGFVFQDPSLLPWRTVHENVLLPLQVNGGGAGRALGPPLPRVTRMRCWRPWGCRSSPATTRISFRAG